MVENVKLRLEIIKLKLETIKTKLLLFGGAFGGVVTLVFNTSFSFSIELLAVFIALILFVAIVLNLFKLGKILEEINLLEKRIKNG